jgi:ArsR family transcriptional regulator, lead/cadmium/zinc/bismuth-responsive transcriptional repressor
MARPRKIDRINGTIDEHHEQCDISIVHAEAVRTARENLPSNDTVADMTAVFAALGDPTRLRIIAALASEEMCVCDLAATLGMKQSAVSHQLRMLRNLGLAKSRRDGRMVYYSLDDEHVSTLYDQALEHVRHRTEQRS